jgi:hypothetical protein
MVRNVVPRAEEEGSVTHRRLMLLRSTVHLNVPPPTVVHPAINQPVAALPPRSEYAFTNPVLRWAWDVGIGPNFIITRKRN